jgi:DNA-binding SARP family transcriptional activator/tetratricopeptide (TPR) repeat protein
MAILGKTSPRRSIQRGGAYRPGGDVESIRLLGPIELWSHGRRHGLGSVKERSVLAILALECGHPVSTDAMATRLWDLSAPEQARDTLGSYVSRLRRRLKQALGDEVKIVSRQGTYTLAADGDIIDLIGYRRLCRQARAIGDTGDAEQAVTLLQAAADMWRGEPLAGLPGDWMQRIRISLIEEHRRTQLELIELELKLGRHMGVIGELHRLAALHPLDERIIAMLMTALYRCDRQADALSTYRQTCDLLLTELGSVPGPRLQELQQQILRSDPRLAVTPRYLRADRQSQPDTLPPDIPGFIGRRQELNALTESRDVEPSALNVDVIEGMPGVGKTALAIRAAYILGNRHPDAQLHVHLRGAEPERTPKTAAAALAELLRDLDVPPTRIPPSTDERATLWQREMANRRAIVIIDDATTADQVWPLLPHAAGCRVLITTRCRLSGLGEARRLRLDPLPHDEATRLFARIAGEENCRDSDAINEIVRRCGHLPLAVRLAAGWFQASSAHKAADLVDDLVSGNLRATEPTIDPAVRAAFEVSYRELSAEEQRTFRRLSLAPSSEITENAAAALTDEPITVLRPRIKALIDHNLLLDTGNNRVGFHDLVRAYARDRADTDDSSLEHRLSLTRLVSYYLNTADRADRILHPHRRRLEIAPGRISSGQPKLTTQQDAQAWMAAEWRDALLVAQYAVEHERKLDGALLVHTMARFLETHGYCDDAAPVHEAALQACRDLDDRRGIAQAALELGIARLNSGECDVALQLTYDALNIYRALGEPHGEAETLDVIGIIQSLTGHSREALAHYQEALTLYRSIGERRGEADALGHSGLSYWHLGRYDESMSHLDGSLAIYREIGDRHGEAMTLNNLGDMQQHRGYHRHAAQLYQESIRIFAEIDGRAHSTIVQHNMGNVFRYKGNYSEALQHYRQAAVAFNEAGDRRSIAIALNNIGSTYRLMGRYSEALIHFEKAQDIAEDIADLYEYTRALRGIADTKQETGNYSTALKHYNQALAKAREIGDTYQEATIHDGIAKAVLQLTGREAARIHWRQALDIFQLLDVPEAQSVAIRLQTIGGIAS